MGLDISNHAVDTALITQRMIPALLGQRSIDDVLDRAANLCVVASRANQWGLRVLQLNQDFLMKQMRGGVERGHFLVLPGFNTDLSIWGRPFFIVADTAEESLEAFSRYMECTPEDLSGVDRVAAAMIGKLDSKKPTSLAGSNPFATMLEGFYPLADHLPELKKIEDRKLASVSETRQRLATILATFQEAWEKRGTKRKVKSEVLEEPVPAAELAKQSPYILMNLASQVLPGWMGRGTVGPTQLFEQIGVPVSHVFETPTALFEPLVRLFPEMEENFSTTIRTNYSLGGYVRPEKVSALRELLEKHARELILVGTGPADAASADLDKLATDYKKILEPVIFAERKGYGFIEAAEVYSGFMGVIN